MAIDRAAVDHVARLARLELSEDERARMQSELSHIIEHAERVQSLELDSIEPTSHAIPLRNVMREDEVRPSLEPSEALANAPESEASRFKVPRILEDG